MPNQDTPVTPPHMGHPRAAKPNKCPGRSRQRQWDRPRLPRKCQNTQRKMNFIRTANLREPPSKQPTREGQIQTANQKRGSIQKARKSPDLERISAPEKAFSRGMNKFPNQKGPRTCQRCSFAGFLIFRGFSHSLYCFVFNFRIRKQIPSDMKYCFLVIFQKMMLRQL